MSQAQLGQGTVVLVSGEAGIGKSAMVEQAVAVAQRSEWSVVRGRAYEREGAPPCWLWIQVTADLIKRSDPAVLSEALGGNAAVLRPLLYAADAATCPADGPHEARLDSPPDRFAVFEAMTRFLINLADLGLLIIVLEDLQWADQFSLQLLEHLATRMQTSHVLIVATSRPPEHYREVPLTEAVGALVRIPGFDWIELPSLNCGEVGLLIAQSGAQASLAQVSEIHARTDGIPFFVEEFARLMVARDGSCVCQPEVIPSGSRAVIRRRLNRLPEHTHSLLVVAAAIGRTFDIRAVAAATHMAPDDAVDWVHWAVLGGVVTEDITIPGMYRFCLGLVRDTCGQRSAACAKADFKRWLTAPPTSRTKRPSASAIGA